MRGKVPVDQCNNAATGITPAYAGKRALCFRTLSHMRDHPRVCGEKRSGKWPRHRWQGSPPRMRGKGGVIRYTNFVHRITPAYAGKSKIERRENRETRDHPRVCGEKSSSLNQKAYPSGSPPRMRGKVSLELVRGAAVGITPAYAGKSALSSVLPASWRDHPRVCGEKYCCTATACRKLGSPPRMRGKEEDEYAKG